ncbi:MAG TPA: 50S ribosomal protein L29 [Candidatus Cloacimonetes bacterium]|nr:50S ribosomal protein L29 [Candidatus Cloacimonadota bacterium]HEX37883.1 50S ribosomal protein L29 [Candidatus Cloacimonadota bacterium]
MLKPDEIREMNIAELQMKEQDLKEEYFNLRYQKTMNRLENPWKLHEVRRDIARVKTIIREKKSMQNEE